MIFVGILNDQHNVDNILQQLQSEVAKIIKNIRESMAGSDGIRAGVVKEVSSFIPGPLFYINNTSFKQGVLPQSLKIAIICPIHKGKSRDQIVNYWP